VPRQRAEAIVPRSASRRGRWTGRRRAFRGAAAWMLTTTAHAGTTPTTRRSEQRHWGRQARSATVMAWDCTWVRSPRRTSCWPTTRWLSWSGWRWTSRFRKDGVERDFLFPYDYSLLW